jgi:hypothetical protein
MAPQVLAYPGTRFTEKGHYCGRESSSATMQPFDVLPSTNAPGIGPGQSALENGLGNLPPLTYP